MAGAAFSLLAVAAAQQVMAGAGLGRDSDSNPSPADVPRAHRTLESTQKQSAQPESQQQDFSELTMEELLAIEVVVTPSRREQSMQSVPYAVSVVTAADIRAAGARSIPDALRLVPGVDVADLAFGHSAVSPRGFHGFLGRQILVLVDGRQIFDSHFGGNLWGTWPFQLEDVERIEVIRGPGGVTWGANAVNGVINVITKDPLDQLGVTLSLGGGSRGTQKEHLGYAFQEGKLRLRMSAEYQGSDGFRKGSSLLGRFDDDFKAGRVGLHAIYDVGPDDTLTFSAGSMVLDGGVPRTPLGGLGMRRHPGAQASYLMANWSHGAAGDNQYELTAYVNDFHVSPGIAQIDYRYQQIALQFSHTLSPAEDQTLTWGVDTRVDLLDASNADPQMLSRGFVSTGIVGVYAQKEWRFAPKWTLDLGARIDYEFYGGFQPSARLSLAYQLTKDSLVFGSISRAFQMPPVGLRFVDLPLLNGLARIVGSRGVDAETLIAYELGYRGKFFHLIDVSADAFWNEFDEITTISPRLGPPGLIAMDFNNRAQASMYGVELEAKYPVTGKLKLLANYTFQRLDWRASVPFHDKDSISPPKHKAMLGARYSPTDDLHLSSHLYYVGSVEAPNSDFPFVARNIDSYLRLDLRAEYEFRDHHASLSVGVRNLLDRGHLEGGTLFLNTGETPRMVFAEYRLQLR